MAKGRRREISPSTKTYGFPIFCTSWVPQNKIIPASSNADQEEPSDSPKPAQDLILVALGGGGGEGRSGVPNVLLIAEFDFVSRSLAADPVFRMGTESEVPYRMAVHPGGDGLVVAFPNGCRSYTWDLPDRTELSKLSLKSSERVLTPLEVAGLQLAMAFSTDGTILATGGEDGYLRVFKWPTMEIILDQKEAHKTVKDLDFSSDDKFLVSVGNSGPCRVWDLASSSTTASLLREDGEEFGFCRFSPKVSDHQILYVTVVHGDYAKIVTWSSVSWKRTGSKRILRRDSISAFNVSKDGEHLAVGTVEGNIVVIRASNMQVQTTVKEAHLGIVTALSFSDDSRALISTSFDSNAHVTVIENRRGGRGFNVWFFILVLILAVLVYYMKSKGVF